MTRLTRAHRLAQNAAVAEALPGINRLWPILDRDEQLWLAGALELIQQGRERSSHMAVSYLRAFADLHGVDVPVEALGSSPSDAEMIIASLRATGPAWRAKMARNHAFEYADQAARRKVLGSAMRHMLDGGRQTLLSAVDVHDDLGWRRVGSPGVCDYCRDYLTGDVIHGEAGRGYDFPVHDNCSCTVEPVFMGP